MSTFQNLEFSRNVGSHSSKMYLVLIRAFTILLENTAVPQSSSLQADKRITSACSFVAGYVRTHSVMHFCTLTFARLCWQQRGNAA